MNELKEFYKSKKALVIALSVILFIVFLILPITTRVRVTVGEAYTDYQRTALYLITYKERPSNYITKDDALFKFGGGGYSYALTAMEKGYAIGGDKYNDYENKIVKFTKVSDLFEADVYTDVDKLIEQGNRGLNRLVYGEEDNGKISVFYTTDHYESFNRVTKANLQSISNTFWYVFVVYVVLICYLYLKVFEPNLKEKIRNLF